MVGCEECAPTVKRYKVHVQRGFLLGAAAWSTSMHRFAKCLQEESNDHMLAALQEYPLPVESRAALQNHLVQHGFSLGVASWVTSNLRPSQDDPR